MLSTSWVRQTANGAAPGHLAFLTKKPSSSRADSLVEARSASICFSMLGPSVSVKARPLREDETAATKSCGSCFGLSEPSTSPRLSSTSEAT